MDSTVSELQAGCLHEFSVNKEIKQLQCRRCGKLWSDADVIAPPYKWIGPDASPRMMKETVNHPPHYGGADDPYETIKVLAAWLTPEQMSGFALGNAIKYLSRAGKKGNCREDLEKCRWYINYALDNAGATQSEKQG